MIIISSVESNSFLAICRVSATKSILYPFIHIAWNRSLDCKIAASPVLYEKNEKNEKNIYYAPDYISGLSRALLRFFPTTFVEIAVFLLFCSARGSAKSCLET